MPERAKQRVFSYAVDAANRLVSVNADWSTFARDNDAQHLCGEAVVGRPLFEFVSDPETQQLYRMILDRVRRERCRVVVPFRCDSPALRRFMELDVSAAADGEVLFQGRIIREEAREPVALFDPSIARTDELVRVCSWCKRVAADGEWVEVEEAVSRLELFGERRLPRMTHGMCPDCAARLRGEVDDV